MYVTNYMKAAIGLFMICLLCVDSLQVEWCYTKTKSYTKTFTVPQKVCRFVGSKRVNAAPAGLSLKPQPRPSSRIVTDSSQTAEELTKMFPGLFLNKKTADDLNDKLKKENILPGSKKPSIILPNGINPGLGLRGVKVTLKHDGDLHCPTYRGLVQAADRMNNTYNQARDIVHFHSADIYQYVHKGTCGVSGGQSCQSGGCYQEKSIVYLMVWKDNPDWPTSFEPFEVESYCSCKGVTP